MTTVRHELDLDGTFDEKYRNIVTSNTEVSVEYDTIATRDGEGIIIRRTVMRLHRVHAKRVILWEEDVVAIPTRDLPNFVRDLVFAYGSACDDQGVMRERGGDA